MLNIDIESTLKEIDKLNNTHKGYDEIYNQYYSKNNKDDQRHFLESILNKYNDLEIKVNEALELHKKINPKQPLFVIDRKREYMEDFKIECKMLRNLYEAEVNIKHEESDIVKSEEKNQMKENIKLSFGSFDNQVDIMKNDLIKLDFKLNFLNGIPNFKNIHHAVALFDLWHEKYEITNYPKNKNKIIIDNILIDGKVPSKKDLTDARYNINNKNKYKIFKTEVKEIIFPSKNN